MSIFTDRELEFLTSLRTNWRRLYWIELAHLLNEDGDPCGHGHEDPSPPERWHSGFRENRTVLDPIDKTGRFS
jgi:hypothetical protein